MILFLMAIATQNASPSPPSVEQPVAPYVQSDHNAGARAFDDGAMWRAFHGEDGVARIVDSLVSRNVADPRISDIFKGQDMVRLRRTLKEQFCYILAGGCHYSGRDMRTAHADMGIQDADMAALVENLQASMHDEGVSFTAQNRLLARLAPMRRDIVKIEGERLAQ